MWAGPKIIPGDPRPQNYNGRLFEQFLQQNPHLTVVNSLSLCEGLITRRRHKNGILEESILDFFIVCDKVLPHVTRMQIDEHKNYVLTNYEQVRKGGKATDTDHATQIMDINLTIRSDKPERRELYNFKKAENQQKFKYETTNTNDFTNCFRSNLPLDEQIKRWQQNLNKFCGKSFQKIRIKRKNKTKLPSSKMNQLITMRNELLRKRGPHEDINALNQEISNLEAQENRNLIL